MRKDKIQISKSNKIGAVALISILIIMAVTLVVALSINLLSISELKIGFNEGQTAKSLIAADACVDEALQRYYWDNSYTGGSLDLDGNSCTISITGSGDSRTLNVISTVDTLIRKLQVIIDVTGGNLAISSWQEKTD